MKQIHTSSPGGATPEPSSWRWAYLAVLLANLLYILIGYYIMQIYS